MGPVGSLPVLLLSMWLFWLPLLLVRAQLSASSLKSSRELDALLQDFSYRSLVLRRIKTGIAYNGNVPSNLTGIKVSAMRLRSGRLRRRGVKAYNEFHIPVGILEQPYVERLVLVYQNLGNWSTLYYPLTGYVYLAPVVGLLAYDASNLSATNLPELDIRASTQPIPVKFSGVKPAPEGSTAQCVSIDLQGSVNFSRLLSPDNVCLTSQQGHFSIVVESVSPSPSPLPPVPSGKGKKSSSSKVWIIVGSVAGGLVLLVLLGALVLWLRGYKERRKMQRMEKEADVGEALGMISVGSSKAPAAGGTRTQPALETEYVP